MDYLRIYEKLICSAKNRKEQLMGYVENHHIIPKSFGGSNDKLNIVALTAREHFIAHRLLAKIYPNSGMVHAIFRMACSNLTTKKYGNITSRTYDYLRKEHSRRISENVESNKKKGRPGREQSDAHVGKRIDSRKKNNISWHSNETAKKISISLTGKSSMRNGVKLTPEQYLFHMKGVEKRKQNGSYERTKEIIQKQKQTMKSRVYEKRVVSVQRKESLKIEKSKKIICPYCSKIGQMIVMKRWHFENCKHR